MNQIIEKDATELAKENYREYGLYVAQGRAYPQLIDGSKSVYKRVIYGMWQRDTGKIVKVSDLAAQALPYHPHPTSISGVIVQLGDGGNKLKLMDTQGNWGDSSKKIEASADRYIGGKISALAKKLFCEAIEYCPTIKGEIDRDEPEALPAYLPLCFINGSSGIPSGLPTLNIPTLDIIGMIDYYIDVLTHKDLEYKPKKFPKPNLEINIHSSIDDWNHILETGKGSLKTGPIMSMENNVITITGLPASKNVDHVRKIIEKEILLDKLDLRDETTRELCIVIEKVPYKQVDMKEIYKRLYTKLQSSETYNMAFFDKDKIYVPCGFDKVVKANIGYLIKTHNNRITIQLQQLRDKLEVLQVIEKMKKTNFVKQLAEMDYDAAVQYIVNNYSCSDNCATKVLQKPISYLTKEHHQEIVDLETDIKNLETDKNDIYEFLLKRYKDLRTELNKLLKNKFKPTTFVKA